jgi:GxxExxY protein
MKEADALLLKKESYSLVGICMEVHNNLGAGFLEIVYKDAIEWELRQAGIPYEREKEYKVKYKDIILPHKFFADFVINNEIILEVKGVSGIHPDFIAQCINYLKVSGNHLALLVNFGEPKLNCRRIVL